MGFFVPLGVYGFKSINGWYRYRGRYGSYAVSERYYELALEYVEREEWEPALRYLESILKAMPDHLRALYYASVCREKLGDRRGASENILDYLKERPDDNEALQLQERVSSSDPIL